MHLTWHITNLYIRLARSERGCCCQVACYSGCQDEVYCSQACATEAWHAHHSLLCCQRHEIEVLLYYAITVKDYSYYPIKAVTLLLSYGYYAITVKELTRYATVQSDHVRLMPTRQHKVMLTFCMTTLFMWIMHSGNLQASNLHAVYYIFVVFMPASGCLL